MTPSSQGSRPLFAARGSQSRRSNGREPCTSTLALAEPPPPNLLSLRPVCLRQFLFFKGATANESCVAKHL